MLYLAGYILACIVTVSGAGMLLSWLYKHSSFKPAETAVKPAPLIRSHALISFSIILPFSALAFLLLTFTATKIAQGQGQEGHTGFVIAALSVPTVCFFAGYFYFKKVVRP
jgi:hypothetical protein